jgi:hypothetical protein
MRTPTLTFALAEHCLKTSALLLSEAKVKNGAHLKGSNEVIECSEDSTVSSGCLDTLSLNQIPIEPFLLLFFADWIVS